MKLIIDIDNNDYELINKTCVTYDWHTMFHGKEKDKEMTFAIFDLVKALKNGKPYEEISQGDLISRGALKKCAIPCEIHNGALTELCVPLYQIDNAPTVETSKIEYKAYNEGFKDGVDQGIKLSERPQGDTIKIARGEVSEIRYSISEFITPDNAEGEQT